MKNFIRKWLELDDVQSNEYVIQLIESTVSLEVDKIKGVHIDHVID